jgi:hypothetical protein
VSSRCQCSRSGSIGSCRDSCGTRAGVPDRGRPHSRRSRRTGRRRRFGGGLRSGCVRRGARALAERWRTTRPWGLARNHGAAQSDRPAAQATAGRREAPAAGHRGAAPALRRRR